MQRPVDAQDENMNDAEIAGLVRAGRFMTSGTGYGQLQAQQPSSMGHILASSPLALLVWYAFSSWTSGSSLNPDLLAPGSVKSYWRKAFQLT